MLTPILCAVIGALILLLAFQQWMHERVMIRAEARWAAVPPLDYLLPEPEPIPLTERLNSGWGELRELAPTRRLDVPIHPRFESYGVDVSVAPTIGIR
jgi:hypothetical protein